MSQLQVPARLVHEPGFCNLWGLDLTVGCQHACTYCHFQRYQELTIHHEHEGQELAESLSVDEFLRRDEYPPELYLSPFTDPLAPAARPNLEPVLRRVLPRSVKVVISTKGIIPRRIFRLLAPYTDQVLLTIGLTSLDDGRNAAVEPGCPPAKARLANFRLAREYGLIKVTARIDPLLPGVDDASAQLATLLDAVAEAGAVAVTASYLFLSPLGSKERLRRLPYLGPATEHCTELCPIEGSAVYSVPLGRKRELYSWFHRECAARGLHFGTCGCKDLRLAGGPFANACHYPDRSACAAPSARCQERPTGEGCSVL